MEPSPDLSTTSPEPSGEILPFDKHQQAVVNPQIESPSQSVTTFTVFPKLPVELRFKIWKLALPGTRVVAINFDYESETITSSARIPAALHTCRESRLEALKVYKLTFGYLMDPGKVYFNPFSDILLYTCMCDENTEFDDPTLIMKINGLESVQFIAGACGASCYCICDSMERTSDWHERLPSLKDIFLADETYDSSRSYEDLRVAEMDGEMGDEFYLDDSNEIVGRALGIQVRRISFEGRLKPDSMRQPSSRCSL
jgi:hypothetical protein